MRVLLKLVCVCVHDVVCWHVYVSVLLYVFVFVCMCCCMCVSLSHADMCGSLMRVLADVFVSVMSVLACPRDVL